MVDLKIAIDYLLEAGYLTIVEDKLTITNKLHREFKPIPRERIELIFPDQPTLVSRQAIWDKFMKDAFVPHQAEGSEGKKYTIRQYSPGLVDELIKIIKSTDYRILIESTKRYYTTSAFKLTFKNYLQKNVWKDEYKKYEEGLRTNSLAYGQGGNAWES